MFGTHTTTEDEFARWLIETYHVHLVCITRGANGAIAVSLEELCEVAGIPITVADTVGAGDAFTAALIWSQFQQWPLKRALTLANRLGSLVAGRPGAMPVLGREIQGLNRRFRRLTQI